MMSSKAIVPIVCLTILISAPRVWGQEENVNTATSALQSVLENLKESAGKLALDNQQLALRDNAIKSQVAQLQIQLGQVQQQGDVVSKAVDRLQEKNPRRGQAITVLEGANFDLDNRNQKTEAAIKLIQQSLEAGYREDQKLLMQIKDKTNVQPAKPVAPTAQELALIHVQKEKLKLMKMIYDSQQRQEALHESVMELQKNAPLQPAADALAHQDLLKGQIKDLQAEIAAYPPEKFSYQGLGANEWDDTQMRQLEVELKALEKNYSQLKTLIDQMDKKVQASRMSVSQKLEGDKLQGNLRDLTHQGEGLSVELEDLRAQMVDLDKRKSHLEAMIQQIN